MAKPRKRAEATPIDSIERLARLFAIYISKDAEPEVMSVKLLAAGFDSPTVGALLGKNPNFANAAKSRLAKAKD
jgi:hypothetical protein